MFSDKKIIFSDYLFIFHLACGGFDKQFCPLFTSDTNMSFIEINTKKQFKYPHDSAEC
jgi:hypothetical protein